MDVFTIEKRSEIMSKIKSKDTTPERVLRRALYKSGARGYRLKSGLPGSPDIVYAKHRLAIFVDGCFWHGCPLCYQKPQGNQPYWEKKLASNQTRDMKATKKLKSLGWTVLRFWEHEVIQELDKCVQEIKKCYADANSKA